MASSGAELETYEVAKCPRCGERHRFALAVKPLGRRVALFGGGQAQEVAFICPKTKQAFAEMISPKPMTEIVGPVDPSQLAHPDAESVSAPAIPTQAGSGEFVEWQKESRAVAFDFCKTMLTVATAAIPLYFAVLQYLGVDHVSRSPWQEAAIIPPILLLVAAAVFVVALRPVYSTVAESEFATFRQHRLQAINTWIVIATTLFMLAVAIAIAVFFAILLSPH